ncbi:MAG TPA: beta-propeller fold lactonase family protein [Candidatus Cybelea sp.]|nr:beta-propeller fold lactonase family protein [Candidatus Cybelea sp.]
MHTVSSILRTAAGIAVASLIAQPLAGCSGATQALPGAAPLAAGASAHLEVPAAVNAMGSAAQPDKKKKQKTLLYVSDNENNRILVFKVGKTQNPPPIRTITSGISLPNGIATDKSGDLYVANYYTNSVTVYAPNSSTPKTKLTTGLNGPWDVKVDGFGNVYVANNPLYGATNYIVEYNAGSSSPSTSWSVPSQGMEISGIAILNPNQQGYQSIYALAYTLNGSGFASGVALSCYPGNSQCVSIGDPFGKTGGIEVAQSPGGSKTFQWIAVDQYIPGIDIFTQGQSTKTFATGGTPEFLTLNAAGNDLFIADLFSGLVTEYTYPGLTKVNTFSGKGGQIYGVATTPSGTLH